MKPVRIFRHISCEGPGYFADVLDNYNIPYEIICIDKGDTPPEDIDNISGLVFMGGSMSVNDNLPWIDQELSLIRQAVSANLPVLGHCLGGQLISKALGGTVTANPVKEIGWLPVQRISNEYSADWLSDFADDTRLFHWHGETFSIPDGATAILKSRHCANQGFVIGNTLALQCHIEMSAPMVAEWADLYSNELNNPDETVQSAEEITRDLGKKIAILKQVAEKLYRRWLKPVLDS